MGQLFTIGCSILSLDDFIRNLKINKINVIADVRSIPYSRITPQFNKENLQERLKKEHILYGEFSKEFGARRTEFCAYEDNQVSFKKTRQLPAFLEGVKRIQKGLEMGYSIGLMCTEKNPLACHRFSLVARGIIEQTGIDVSHVLTDASIVSTELLENQMLKDFNLEQDLFSNRNERIETAYNMLNKKIGYILPQKEESCDKEEMNNNAKDIYMFG